MNPFSFSEIKLTLLRVCVLSALICFSFSLTGCRPEVQEKNDSQADKEKAKATAASLETQCEKLIRSAVHMCDPERFTIESDPDTVVGLLNDWATTCGALGYQLDEAELTRWHGADQVEALNNDRFNLYDASHIRNSILCHNIWTRTAKGKDTELERVISAFNFVARNVALHPDAEEIPLKKHEVMFWGLGTAEDRAVFFADILRQNRIDAVIITPASAGDKTEQENQEEDQENDDKPHWLVGAVLEDGIYLFDMRMGMPVPGADHQPGDWEVTDVATLKEVRENDELLRFLDVEENVKYPLSSEDLQNVKIGLIGYPTLWQSRFETLQTKLTEDQHFLLYDGLVNGKSGEGSIARVLAKAEGMYSEDNLEVWPYLAQQAEARVTETTQVKEYVQQFQSTFQAYFDCEVQEEGQASDGEPLSIKPSRSMAKARLAYMNGKENQAIKNYTAIRMVTMTEVMPLLHQYNKKLYFLLHATAMDNAFYWLATAQIEAGDYEPAIGTLEEYMRQTQGGGRWRATAHEKLIDCYIRVNKPAISVQLTKQIIDKFPPNSFERYRFQFLMKQIRQLQQKEREEQKKAAEEKSEG